MDDRAGTDEVVMAATAASESDDGAMAEEFAGVLLAVVGLGREARVGEESSRVVR